jgi:hypothetical protein
MSSYKILAFISDIHIGNKNVSPEVLKKMLKNNFIKPLLNMKRLDAIIVGGDVSHSVISLNSEYGELYLWFFNQIYKIAKNRKDNPKIVILEGTPSHDLDHLATVKHLEDNEDGVDFRIYDNYQADYLFEDYRMLVLPDKRLNKPMKQKVLDLLEDEYDLVLGHGLIDKLSFPIQESENLNTEGYHFPIKKLFSITKGPILFGHYHKYTNIENKFFYSGSFTKLERGEGIHGFLVIGINDADHSQFIVEQYVNVDSVDYHEITINEKELIEYDAVDIINAIKDLIIVSGKNDLFTIRISIENNTYITDKVFMIDDAFRGNKNISIIKKVYNKSQSEKSISIKKKKERLSYIFDPSLTVEEVFIRYYNEEIRPNNPKYKDTELDIKMVSDIIMGF